MSEDFRTVPAARLDEGDPSDPRDAQDPTTTAGQPRGEKAAGGRRAPLSAATPLSDDSRLAIEIRDLVERGEMDEARERFGNLVAFHQRRASRIAYQYLREAAEADEAVQDAFVKVFTHIRAYREAWPFEVWFTRILINGCLDRRKARSRRERWRVGGDVSDRDQAHVSGFPGLSRLSHWGHSIPSARSATTSASDPERQLLARERRARMAAAVARLDGRQRTIFMLCHFGDFTPREVSVMTGINESTVRVHLFRAARKLRVLLGGQP